MDIAGIVLKYVLTNSEDSLDIWNKLRLPYFKGSYTTIYGQIAKFYNEYAKIPTLAELETITREPTLRAGIAAIATIELPEDISIDIIVDAIVDEYAQNETLDKLDEFIDGLTLMSAEDIKGTLAEIVLYLDEKTHSSEDIFTMNSVSVSDPINDGDRVNLGINDFLDQHSGGFNPSDFILIGGYRGSGKSVVSANITANQWKMGNVGLYFSIEMPGYEIYDRHLAILSGVDAGAVKNRTLSKADCQSIANIKQQFFKDGEEVYNDYLMDGDFAKFEKLLHTKPLQTDKQLIIVDNRSLTIADIDMHMHKCKAQYGDKFKVCVVDYINQITSHTVKDSQYDWIYQIELAKQLKNLARKYEVCVVSPYQIDKSGEARFSKGLLDAADAAFLLSAGQDHIKFSTSKVRGFSAIDFASIMNWDTLQLSGDEYIDLEEAENDDDDLSL